MFFLYFTLWLKASVPEQFAFEFKRQVARIVDVCNLPGLKGQAVGGSKDKKNNRKIAQLIFGQENYLVGL